MVNKLYANYTKLGEENISGLKFLTNPGSAITLCWLVSNWYCTIYMYMRIARPLGPSFIVFLGIAQQCKPCASQLWICHRRNTCSVIERIIFNIKI